MMEDKKDMEKAEVKSKASVKPTLSKHLSSTFSPMIGQYMSDDQLADHVSRQMTFFHKKYEPGVQPVEEEKKKSKKKVKFKKSKSSVATTAASDEDLEREKERQEYRDGLRDRMLEDLELLRDYYKRIYKKALKEKVANQHKEMKHRDAQAVQREKKLRQKEEEQKHKVIIRLQKSKVLNDHSYKEGIEETVYHKIIKVEHQLKKQGYLSKVSESKAFWDYILAPGNLARILEKGTISWEDVQRHERTYRSLLESTNLADNKKWTASDLDKLVAANNKKPRQWHKVQHTRAKLFTPSGLTDISSSQSERRLSPLSATKTKSAAKSAANNTAMTLEQLFPKVEFPQLAAYTLVFGDQGPDPEEIEREIVQERKEEAKRDTRTKLLTMFSHALANRAATQRLIERNEKFNFSQLEGSTSVSELLGQGTERKTERLQPVPLTTVALKAHDGESRSFTEEDEVESTASSLDYPGREIQRDINKIPDLHREYRKLPPIAVPLSLDRLTDSCPIKESKSLSTLWVNPFTQQITADQ